MDYTLSKYESLLAAIQLHNIPVYGIKEWIKNPQANGIILRHDVDRWPVNALKMAKLEYKYNISSTYYFRRAKSTFKPSIIKKIADLSHEVGYHYEDLSLAKGDYKKAIQLFNKHLKVIRQIVPVKTIAMHGRPLSRFNNLDLWKHYDFKNSDLIGETFLSIDYSDIYYFTDTGRNWYENKNNLRDFTESKIPQQNIKNTDNLIQFIKNNSKNKIAIATHPERWNNNKLEWIIYYIIDFIVIVIKYIVKVYRKINLKNKK